MAEMVPSTPLGMYTRLTIDAIGDATPAHSQPPAPLSAFIRSLEQSDSFAAMRWRLGRGGWRCRVVVV